MSQRFAYKGLITGSSTTNANVGATAFLTGSVMDVSGLSNVTVAAALWTGSVYGVSTGSIGAATPGTIFLAYSMDNTQWNRTSISGSITLMATPVIATLNFPATGFHPTYVTGILYNSSGAALSGSIWIQAS